MNPIEVFTHVSADAFLSLAFGDLKSLTHPLIYRSSDGLLILNGFGASNLVRILLPDMSSAGETWVPFTCVAIYPNSSSSNGTYFFSPFFKMRAARSAAPLLEDEHGGEIV